MDIIRDDAQYVWVNNQRFQVLNGSVNQSSRCLNIFNGGYESFGDPRCVSFDEVEKVEYPEDLE